LLTQHQLLQLQLYSLRTFSEAVGVLCQKEEWMSLQSHLAELVKRHEALDRELAAIVARPSAADEEIAALKRRKLLLKDQIERLKGSSVH
jgi:hypothetical protein